MKKILFFNGFMMLILFGLFLWQTIEATFKWLDKNTIISSSNKDDGAVLFPSITVCKKYLNGLHVEVIENKSMPVQDKIAILHEKTWRKNEVFYFFSHSKMFNSTFPCNTQEGATEEGKPCSFPYLDPSDGRGLQSKCTQPLNYCYTRTDKNNVIFTSGSLKSEFWGYCSKECKGEMPGPESDYNLAKETPLFSPAWTQALFDLRQFEAGHCFTYDPPEESESGINNGLYILLGRESLIKPYTKQTKYARDSSYMTYSFNIFLHEKGQFWLKSDMETLGQFGPIEVLPRDQVTGTFSLNRIRNLDKDDKHCKADPAYSYTQCLMDYSRDISNCSVDVFANDFNCTSDGLYALIKTLEKIRTLTKKEIVKMTGCYPKCEIYKYNFHLKQETDVKWKKEWLSSFYLSAETTTYQMSMENYSYDAQDLIGSIGGYLGLFLGWSVMSIVTAAPVWCSLLSPVCCKKSSDK